MNPQATRPLVRTHSPIGLVKAVLMAVHRIQLAAALLSRLVLFILQARNPADTAQHALRSISPAPPAEA